MGYRRGYHRISNDVVSSSYFDTLDDVIDATVTDNLIFDDDISSVWIRDSAGVIIWRHDL